MSTVLFLMQQLHKHEGNCYLMYVNGSREDMIPHKYTTYTVIYVIKFNIKNIPFCHLLPMIVHIMLGVSHVLLTFIINDGTTKIYCLWGTL